MKFFSPDPLPQSSLLNSTSCCANTSSNPPGTSVTCLNMRPDIETVWAHAKNKYAQGMLPPRLVSILNAARSGRLPADRGGSGNLCSSICAGFETRRSELSVDKITATVVKRSLLQGTCTRNPGRPPSELLTHAVYVGGSRPPTGRLGNGSPQNKAGVRRSKCGSPQLLLQEAPQADYEQGTRECS